MVALTTVDLAAQIRSLTAAETARAARMFAELLICNPQQARSAFRGLSEDYLRDRFDPQGVVDPAELFRRLFFFGDKAKHFLRSSADLAAADAFVSVADTSSKTAEAIYSKFRRLASNKNPAISGLRARTDFFDYFESKKNKSLFVAALLQIGESAYAYYIELLHTAGRKGLSEESTALSTSESFKTAMRFAGPLRKGCVVVFVDRPMRRSAERKKLLRALSERGLPSLAPRDAFYPTQREVTLRAGLIPHNIVGVYRRVERDVVLNPYLFTDKNRATNIASTPLHIDQSLFRDRLKFETTYQRFFIVEHGGEPAPG